MNNNLYHCSEYFFEVLIKNYLENEQYEFHKPDFVKVYETYKKLLELSLDSKKTIFLYKDENPNLYLLINNALLDLINLLEKKVYINDLMVKMSSGNIFSVSFFKYIKLNKENEKYRKNLEISLEKLSTEISMQSEIYKKNKIIQDLQGKSGLSNQICNDIFNILVSFQNNDRKLAFNIINVALIPHLKQEKIISQIGIAFGMLVDDVGITKEESIKFSTQIIHEILEENKSQAKHFCTKCGKEIQSDWNFCNYCGKQLNNMQTNQNFSSEKQIENMTTQEKYKYLSDLVIQGGNFADIDEAIEESIKQYELDINSIDLSNKQEALSKIIMIQVQKDIDETIALAKEQYGI